MQDYIITVTTSAGQHQWVFTGTLTAARRQALLMFPEALAFEASGIDPQGPNHPSPAIQGIVDWANDNFAALV